MLMESLSLNINIHKNIKDHNLTKAIEYIQKGSSMNVVYDMYKKK